MRENVRMASEARQTPNLLPSGEANDPVLLTRSAAGGAAAAGPEGFRPLRLAVLHGGGTAAALREKLPGVRVVPVREAPDLVWDVAAGQAVTALGDIAAHGVGLDALPGVAGKWDAVRRIQVLSERASLKLRLHPHDGLHRAGAEIEVEADGMRAPRLTLVGLSGNGTMHYLYPLPSDPARIVTDEPFRLRLAVTPPFGADHVVAVSASTPLDGLNAELMRLDGRPAARRAAELLAEAAAQAQDWQSGIQGLFTAP